MPLLASVPLLLVAVTTAVIGALLLRALRDDSLLEALRLDVRRLGDTHRAVCEARAGQPDVDARRDAGGRLQA